MKLFYSRAEFNREAEKSGLLGTQPHGYVYAVDKPEMNTDPFVRKLMKRYDPHIYKAIYGWSKLPREEYAYSHLIQFAQNANHQTPPLRDKLYRETLQEVRSIVLPKEKMPIDGIEIAIQKIETSTSAGFSFPGKTKKQVLGDLFDLASYTQHMVGYRYPCFVAPTKLALRGHLKPVTDPKTRVVWVYPGELSVMEARWAIPFYEHLESNVKDVHFGPGSMRRLAKMMNYCNPGRSYVTLDWSCFDASVPAWLLEDAFTIVRDSFDFTKGVGIDGPFDIDGEKVEKEYVTWGFLIDYFITTPMMLPTGDRFFKRSGVPSGSMFTQIIGSIVNLIVQRYLYRANKIHLEQLFVLGDDSYAKVMSITFSRSKLENMIVMAKELFGMTIKPEKVKVAKQGQPRSFLGYSFDGVRLVRDDLDWMRMALYPEHTVCSLDTSLSRLVAFYLLGGCNSDVYSTFFDMYLRSYDVRGREIRVDRSLQRLLRYVFRVPRHYMDMPCVEKLNVLDAPFSLVFGGKVYLT